jgi:hypothetical protein
MIALTDIRLLADLCDGAVQRDRLLAAAGVARRFVVEQRLRIDAAETWWKKGDQPERTVQTSPQTKTLRITYSLTYKI